MPETEPKEQPQIDLLDLGPPQPIDHVYFFHGWTLTPDRPGWYKNMARFVEKGFGIEATVAELPDTDEPDPGAWEAAIDETVTNPASSILVLHSLAFINGFRYISNKKLDDPSFQVGGVLGVGANISAYVSDEVPTGPQSRVQSAVGNVNLSPLPFREILHHYIPDFGEFTVRSLMVQLAARQIALLHGTHDPFVPYSHTSLLGNHLDADVYIDDTAAHFSGEHRDSRTGLYIPPCDFNLTLAFILSNMIMAVAPEDRYETAGRIQLDESQIVRRYMGRGLSFFAGQPPDMQ